MNRQETIRQSDAMGLMVRRPFIATSAVCSSLSLLRRFEESSLSLLGLFDDLHFHCIAILTIPHFHCFFVLLCFLFLLLFIVFSSSQRRRKRRRRTNAMKLIKHQNGKAMTNENEETSKRLCVCCALLCVFSVLFGGLLKP